MDNKNYRSSKKNNIKKNNSKNNSTKNLGINLRVTEEERKLIHENAKEHNMSVSSYIITQCTENKNELIQLIPDAVETWNVLNEILHAMKSMSDAQLIEKLNSILNAYKQKNIQNQGDICNGRNN